MTLPVSFVLLQQAVLFFSICPSFSETDCWSQVLPFGQLRHISLSVVLITRTDTAYLNEHLTLMPLSVHP